jgi:hypothetical protein
MAGRNFYYPPIVSPVGERGRDESEPSLPGLRLFGLGDNAANYRRWFQPEVYQKLIFENINIPPFVGHATDPRASAVIYFYSIGRLLATNTTTPGLETALCCAELLLPMINSSLLCSQYESRQILLQSVKALMVNARRLNREIRGINNVWLISIQSEDGDLNHSDLARHWNQDPDRCPFVHGREVPEGIPLTKQRADRMTPEEAMVYLLFLAQHFPRRQLPIELLATTCVACAKKGQMTAIERLIENAIQTELKISVSINPDSVRILFQHFVKEFDDKTAPVCIERWSTLFPDHAVRIRLTIEQVIFSKLSTNLLKT